METEQSKESIQQEDPVIEEQAQSEKAGNSANLLKLVFLVVLAFVVMKYGVPLMNQISEKTTNTEDSAVINKEKQPDGSETPVVQLASDIRLTKGYEAWEPAVREQIESWVADGEKYKLLSIEVNDDKNLMEIRYRVSAADGFTSKKKVVLEKDGFGDRFIYSEGGKEFLVYPPGE